MSDLLKVRVSEDGQKLLDSTPVTARIKAALGLNETAGTLQQVSEQCGAMVPLLTEMLHAADGFDADELKSIAAGMHAELDRLCPTTDRLFPIKRAFLAVTLAGFELECLSELLSKGSEIVMPEPGTAAPSKPRTRDRRRR